MHCNKYDDALTKVLVLESKLCNSNSGLEVDISSDLVSYNIMMNTVDDPDPSYGSE